MILRALLLLLALFPAGAGAHDSWLVAADGGRMLLATGNRYPAAEGPAVPAPVTCRQGSCWVQTGEADVELTPQLVEVYLGEARPSPDIHRRWQDMREAGLTWQERYSKFARIEVSGGGARQPVGAPFEIVREGPLVFRVFAFGKPVAAQAVEMVGTHAAEWSRTDETGRVRFTGIPRGGCIVRAIKLEPEGTAWRSRFATLAFVAS